MNDQCYLVPGEFGIFVQVALGCMSLLFLITKYTLEKPRRSFLIFLKDLISILCGSSILHVLNICLCIFIFRNNILVYLYKSEIDECSIYFIHTIIDATLGLYLEYKIFSFYSFLQVRKYYLSQSAPESIYKPIDTFSHFSEFVKLIQTEKKNGDQKELPKEQLENENRNIFTVLKQNLLNRLHFIKKEKKCPNQENNNNYDSSLTQYEKSAFINSQVVAQKIQKEYNEENEMNKEKCFSHYSYSNSSIQNIYFPTRIEKPTENNINDKNNTFGINSFTDEMTPIGEVPSPQKKPFIYSLTISNEYEDDDDIVIFENREIYINKGAYEKYSNSDLLQCIFLWVSVVLTMKLFVIIFFFLFFPILNTFALCTISSITDQRFKLCFVMIISPFFLNLLIYFFTDNIIKMKHQHLPILKQNDKL